MAEDLMEQAKKLETTLRLSKKRRAKRRRELETVLDEEQVKLDERLKEPLARLDRVAKQAY